MLHRRSIWLGFDPREAAAYAVARESIRTRFATRLPINGVVLDMVRRAGLYRRPTEQRLGRLWDVISGAHMATEFAISRFLVPHLAQTGWALFADCDVLARADVSRIFDLADPRYAVMCVKHNQMPISDSKMDGQAQTAYPRKNWSSVMLFNCDHPSNAGLTIDLINTVPGRDLHRFCWLADDEIGELPTEWNWLVGYSASDIEPKIVHYTDGGPWLSAFADAPYADEWRAELNRWAA